MSNLLSQASLVMIPSGYKEDVVYSPVPTDGSGDLAFTRASNGTRINSQGLVEVCPWNLLGYSEDFSNAYWSKDPSITIDSNVATAPNGTTTADRLNFLSSANAVYKVISSIGTNIFSVYIKGEGANIGKEIQLEIGGVGGFNFTLTGEWQRLTANATNCTSVAIKRATSGQADSVLAWGAQLNIGSTAKPYFPTTDRLNVPRLTYQNGGGGCPSLLLEKQSTNLALYSEQFDDAYWTKQNLTITANSGISPDGTQNADLFTLNTLNGEHNVYAPEAGLAITPNAQYTFSCYVKKGTGRYFCTTLYFTGVGFGPYATFDLNTATLVASGASYGTYVSSKIESMGNDWYRCSVTGYGNYSSLIIAPDIRSASSLIPGVAFTGASETFYVWGAQIEASSYPTSYIPTTSASATRVADACYKTGISSLIGQTEGTVFVECAVAGIDIANSRRIVSLSDGTTSNAIVIINTANSTNLSFAVVDAGSIQVSISATSAITFGQTFKMAFAYKNNDFAVYLNGQQVGTDNSGTIPACSKFAFDRGNSTFAHEGTINQAVLFTTRLTNDELASLTTI